MSQDGVNQSRRRFLYAATGAVGTVGAVGVASVFVKSWFPGERAKAVGAPVKVDVSGLKLGEMVIAEWRGKPIFILRRTPESVDRLKDQSLKERLADPESGVASQQPEYAQNETRALDDEMLIIEGVCTHLGCSPKFVPEVEPQTYDADWQGGFFCPCHGSKFDLAGRVFKNVPAPSNMKVPPHRFDGSVVIIGEETV